ncbi:SDR family oxidoreductase [Streptomyces sp. CA2R106]|uniref:SDR family oxidoreductase n=1 Tax=Streptomyces sp. CA2R106 TaxID=3120153 RepID=UPI00300827AB
MTDRHHPRTVLVTGGASGLGKATVAAFLARGWNVAATARRPGAADRPDPAGNLLLLPMDVRDEESVGAAVERAAERFGRIDCLVNNAGAGLLSVFEATPMTAVRDLFETNVFGVMRVTRAVLPHFAAQGGGRVVNVSSGAGIVPEPLMSLYSATKFAVEGFTESLRHELAVRGVTVKLVEPGLVPGTGFVRNTEEASRTVPVPPAYAGYVRQAVARYQEGVPAGVATPEAVAEAVAAAAEEPADRLRHLVGEDVEEAARMRRETSEREYEEWALARAAAG